jgi:hypothetical protein
MASQYFVRYAIIAERIASSVNGVDVSTTAASAAFPASAPLSDVVASQPPAAHAGKQLIATMNALRARRVHPSIGPCTRAERCR